mmetsp:Transcript_20946/g.51950  ORF Transcript_20946/g.51950 Transcript_20946/m.51950 type:complete len:238 (-) Transcript_20946:1233-1946(-)
MVSFQHQGRTFRNLVLSLDLCKDFFLRDGKGRTQNDSGSFCNRDSANRNQIGSTGDGEIHSGKLELALVLDVLVGFGRGHSARSSASLSDGFDTGFERVLCGRESKPSIQHSISDVDVTAEFLLEEFGKILHHAFQASRLFEICPCLVLVLGVDEFKDDTLVLSTEGLCVCLESNHEVVGISWVGRISSGWIGDVSLAISLRTEQRVQLVVFDVNHQALRRIRFVLKAGNGTCSFTR